MTTAATDAVSTPAAGPSQTNIIQPRSASTLIACMARTAASGAPRPKAGMTIALVAGVAFALLLVTRKAGQASEAVVDAITPTNQDNIFARGVDAIGDAIDDGDNDDSFALGSWIFDIFHPEFDPNAPIAEEDQRLQREFSSEVIG